MRLFFLQNGCPPPLIDRRTTCVLRSIDVQAPEDMAETGQWPAFPASKLNRPDLIDSFKSKVLSITEIGP